MVIFPKRMTDTFLQKIEEMPGYDLSQFVADMGGSLGFLLGLSVLGLIGLFEKVNWQITTTIERTVRLAFHSFSSVFQTMALVAKRRSLSGKRPDSQGSGVSFSPNLSSKATGDSASTTAIAEELDKY